MARGVALNSTIGLCALLCLLILAAAAAISVHIPILTRRNMIVALPAIYKIAAELTSRLMRRWALSWERRTWFYRSGLWARRCPPTIRST
jgi:hypothetical protein